MSYWGGWAPYLPVAQRRKQAQQKIEKLRKKGEAISPVVIEGRTIARSFWGKSWCGNLEKYGDYENRLPRGRAYVRNGSVADLKIGSGCVNALVSGSSMYKVTINITPVSAARWAAICKDCAGSVGSLVELLQGKLSQSVMERVCRKEEGLFPSPEEIKLGCSCPDWADMCKHVAAVLYGIGARLDAQPELLFMLRGVDANELIAKASARLPLADAPATARVMATDDISALFGIDMGEEEPKPRRKPARPKATAAKKTKKRTLLKTKATKKTRKYSSKNT